VAIAAETHRVSSDEAPSVPAMEAPALAGVAELLPNIDAIETRYPLLRNAL
jgi:hypothetical protein